MAAIPAFWVPFEAVSTVLLAARPRSLLVRLAGFATLLFCFLGTIHAMANAHEKKMSDYGTGSAFAAFALAWVVLWIENPLETYRYKDMEDVNLAKLSFWQRMYWGQSILRNPRNVGWNCQVSVYL